MLERTLVLIKPGLAYGDRSDQAREDVVEASGGRLRFTGFLQLSPLTAREFYAEHAGKPFFQGLVEYMVSGPCQALVIEGDDVIRRVREALPVLRSRYGTALPKNAFHASDSLAAAAREIAFAKGRCTSCVSIRRPPTVCLRRIHEDAKLPSQGTAGAAGFDLYAVEYTEVPAGRVFRVGTGWEIAVPAGYELQVRSRSGLAARGIMVANSPGTIDADFRGEIAVLLHNTTTDVFSVAPGDRIAQAVLAPVQPVEYMEVGSLDSTDRGTGGFGSTGR